jgi:hypothetical protein
MAVGLETVCKEYLQRRDQLYICRFDRERPTMAPARGVERVLNLGDQRGIGSMGFAEVALASGDRGWLG